MKSVKSRPIKDYCLGIYDGPHATPKEAEDGPIFLGIKNFTEGGSLTFGEVRRVSEEEYTRWTRRVVPQAGDLVFTYEATLHRYALIPDGFRGCLGRRVALLRADPKRADARYLLYYFLSSPWRRVVEGNVVTGATVDRIPLERFPDFPVAVPELRVQRRIADALSVYDDLIENNRRRMALLGDAARELYSEWFVRLGFPGYEHTRIRNGMPAGWARKSLAQLAEFRLGKMLDQNKNKGDLRPYLANVNVRWGELDLDALREMRFEESELEAFGLRFGDIVMCEGGEPGRCALWKDQLPGMMIQKAIHRIRALPQMSPYLLYHALRYKAQSGQMAGLFTGATIKHLPREKLALVEVVTPPADLMALFHEHVELLEKQRTTLEAANRRAAQARDLLLPRLMSGEIAV